MIVRHTSKADGNGLVKTAKLKEHFPFPKAGIQYPVQQWLAEVKQSMQNKNSTVRESGRFCLIWLILKRTPSAAFLGTKLGLSWQSICLFILAHQTYTAEISRLSCLGEGELHFGFYLYISWFELLHSSWTNIKVFVLLLLADVVIPLTAGTACLVFPQVWWLPFPLGVCNICEWRQVVKEEKRTCHTESYAIIYTSPT